MARLNRIGLGAARTATVPCAAAGARGVAASFALEPCIGAAFGDQIGPIAGSVKRPRAATASLRRRQCRGNRPPDRNSQERPEVRIPRVTVERKAPEIVEQ